MANQSPSDRNNGGGDVTKAERRSPAADKTDWRVYAGNTGPMSSDNGVYSEE